MSHPERRSRHPERSEGSAVQDALRSLRAADEREAPSYDAVVARARRPRPVVWTPARAAMAAALVLVVGSALVYKSARPQPLTVPAEVLGLSMWRPITDALLNTPNRRLLQEAPRLDASLLPAPQTDELPEPDSRLRW